MFVERTVNYNEKRAFILKLSIAFNHSDKDIYRAINQLKERLETDIHVIIINYSTSGCLSLAHFVLQSEIPQYDY